MLAGMGYSHSVSPAAAIGANAVVIRPVPPDSVVIGVPGQVISRERYEQDFSI